MIDENVKFWEKKSEKIVYEKSEILGKKFSEKMVYKKSKILEKNSYFITSALGH